VRGGFKTYGVEEIDRFLRAVDRHLQAPTYVVIIGGSAAALAHHASSATEDVDTITNISAQLIAMIDHVFGELKRITAEKAIPADWPGRFG
jgi:hypothetical protein